MKENGDIVTFLRKKNYIMLNNDLGGGDFGKTVLLEDPYINELFVAKMYQPRYPQIKEKFYANFLDEIKILYNLNHPNVVRIYNYYAYEEQYTGYILMEYVNGMNIDTFFEKYSSNYEKTVSIDEIFMQLINAFSYIEEKGIIHRDIREGNIMIDDDGVVKVIDFGIGKISMSSKDICDSLAIEINRAGSDTLPKEYFEGVYTSQTDMFYLAELFCRLLKKLADDERIKFSYYHILKKMMEKNPVERYETFGEIKSLIEKQDFIHMEISKQDKEVYQRFAKCIYESLMAYKMERKFNYDVQSFAYKLDNAIEQNMFEECIQNNSQVISSIVVGGYRYAPNKEIPCQVVKDFLKWFKKSTKESQQLILKNLINKLSNIGVVFEPDDDLPFN